MGTAPSLNSRQMNGPFATPLTSARAFWGGIGMATVTGAMATERGAGWGGAGVGAKSGDAKWLSSNRARAVIVTDDRAPIEERTRRMLLESKEQ